jgi:hypothetical protein
LLATCDCACPSRLYFQAAHGEHEIPVGLLDERQLIHQDLRQLAVGEVGRPPGELDLPALGVDGPAARQRLNVGGAQRRRELRVQPRELVAGFDPRRREIDGESSARPRRAAVQTERAHDLILLEPAVDRAADCRRARRDGSLIGEHRHESRIEDALRRANVLTRGVLVESRDDHVVVLLERQLDRVGEREKQRQRLVDPDARRQDDRDLSLCGSLRRLCLLPGVGD